MFENRKITPHNPPLWPSPYASDLMKPHGCGIKLSQVSDMPTARSMHSHDGSPRSQGRAVSDPLQSSRPHPCPGHPLDPSNAPSDPSSHPTQPRWDIEDDAPDAPDLEAIGRTPAHSAPAPSTPNRSHSTRPNSTRSGPGHAPHALAGASIPGGSIALTPPYGLPQGDGLDAKVLVLNKFYAAIRVISARRAFSLLVRDAAEVIHVDNGQYQNHDLTSWMEVSDLAQRFRPETFDWVRTVRVQIAVPRVIRLLGYDRLPAQEVKLNRRNLFARDRNQCQYCGHFFPTSELSIDHVKPRTQGGPDTWENLVCSCVKCNARKGGRTPEQARMKLVRRPIRPRRNPLITIKLGSGKYDSWKAFLDEAYWSVELR